MSNLQLIPESFIRPFFFGGARILAKDIIIENLFSEALFPAKVGKKGLGKKLFYLPVNGTEPFQKGRKIPFHICVIMSRKNQKIESFIVEKFISGGISGCKKFFIHAEYC